MSSAGSTGLGHARLAAADSLVSERSRVRRVLDEVKAAGRSALSAAEARRLCEAYAIPVPAESIAASPAEAVRLATAIGFPVVMKVVSPQILHKSERSRWRYSAPSIAGHAAPDWCRRFERTRY
jgi:acyl-CoA synthetase (NDP forming)